MIKNNPTVSVLMPVYNGEAYLTEAIESILNQTFKDYEFIIIDDGSSDRSLEIIKSYKDPRIKVIEHKVNMKLIYTLNEGMDLSCGKYIVRMDCDDVSIPCRIERQVEYMDKHSDVCACGTWAKAINEEGKILFMMRAPIGFWLKYNFWKPSPLIHPSVILRNSYLRKVRFAKIPVIAEDYDMWLQLYKKHKLANIGRYLLKYRVHKKSISQEKRDLQLTSSYDSFRKILRFENISFEEFKSLAEIEYKLPSVVRMKILIELSKKIDYPWWMILLDSLVYALRKNTNIKPRT